MHDALMEYVDVEAEELCFLIHHLFLLYEQMNEQGRQFRFIKRRGNISERGVVF